MTDYIVIGALAANFILLIVILIAAFGKKADKDSGEKMKQELFDEMRKNKAATEDSMKSTVKILGEMLALSQSQVFGAQDKKLEDLTGQLSQKNDVLQKTVADMLTRVDAQFKSFTVQSEQKLDNIRSTIENRLRYLQEDNAKKLEMMRATVDEKLQKTLEDRISQSFKLVSDRLEQVYKGLGEMQALASGVGDLKKVLSGVKTRGILGEIQLGAILEEIMPPEQYEKNVVTKKDSRDPVEFAIRLPGEENACVYLPIDAKFPADIYSQLVDAYDTADQSLVDAALKNLERTIKSFAKTIRDKYIDPPNTTDFAIMFLPFEGLYAEVVRRGLVEILQREYKINIAGPTTMAALLNSLQMGFKTLAIQKHSGEVWNILGAVKTEFDKFSQVISLTQQRLEQAHTELDKLVGVRTRKIQSKLRHITALPELESKNILAFDAVDEAESLADGEVF